MTPSTTPPGPPSTTASCSATQVTTCSLVPCEYGHPSASVSFGPTVKDLGNGVYEGTIVFQGHNCAEFADTEEIKIDGGASAVVVYSAQENGGKTINGCSWTTQFTFTSRQGATSGQQCMEDGMRIKYEFSDGCEQESFDYTFGCGNGGEFDLPELCWSGNSCGSSTTVSSSTVPSGSSSAPSTVPSTVPSGSSSAPSTVPSGSS
ncbi:hypothetical protein PICMEDRAFT_74829, partial [Pichia membranifaciens NRRL Y-2026]